MIRWFHRAGQQPTQQLPPPPLPPLPEHEKDWSAGDVAKCVNCPGPWMTYPDGEVLAGPRLGQTLRVCAVELKYGAVALSFSAFPDRYFAAGYFRKLRACSTDFREQLEGRTPVTVPSAIPELVR